MKWNVVKANNLNIGSVSKSSGVYCFIKSQIIEGIKINANALYVGKSKSIRSRLSQHLNYNKCHNHALLIDLVAQSRDETIEFHYTEIPDSKIDQVERELISKLKPKHNILLKGV
ncbi:GIY-YIG nuclease family protein [Paracoccaceae bacterium]|nr:GIY-YIG nuclease family protein [Paracoccaceae bacterium]